jgi:hypothetical protein
MKLYKRINPELHKALEVLKKYHPVLDAHGADNVSIDLEQWNTRLLKAGIGEYQRALLTVGIFSQRATSARKANMVSIRLHQNRGGRLRFVVWDRYYRPPTTAAEGKDKRNVLPV